MQYAANASKLHKLVGETLAITPGFEGCPLRQEVIVSELFPTYPNNKDRYDWVIPRRQTIVECHGIQHYQVQSFGSEADDAIINFKTQQKRDFHKQEIALLNGWTYIIIPYWNINKISPAYLIELYETNLNIDKPVIQPEKESQPDLYHEQLLARAREYRREQYQRMKVIKNGNKRLGSRTSSSSKEEA